MLLVINRLGALPEEMWIQILSFSQHIYIPAKRMAVGAEALEHSHTEQQQVTAYNNHNIRWEHVGAQFLSD